MFNSKTKNLFVILMAGCIFTFYGFNSLIFAQTTEENQTTKTQEEKTTETQQNTSVTQTNGEETLLLHLDLGLAFSVKIPSDSLSSAKTAGVSLFVKLTDLDNLYPGLELLLNSRYSAIATDVTNDQKTYDAKVGHFAIGSSVKFKINESFYVLGGLDLGFARAKKYIAYNNEKSFSKFSFGIISAVDYTCYFNPYLHVGAKFNVNLGSISSMQTLLYAGLSF